MQHQGRYFRLWFYALLAAVAVFLPESAAPAEPFPAPPADVASNPDSVSRTANRTNGRPMTLPIYSPRVTSLGAPLPLPSSAGLAPRPLAGTSAQKEADAFTYDPEIGDTYFSQASFLQPQA